jgi:dienelactone hydrolase
MARDKTNMALRASICIVIFLAACTQPPPEPSSKTAAPQSTATIQQTALAAAATSGVTATSTPPKSPAVTATLPVTPLPTPLPTNSPPRAAEFSPTPDPYVLLSVEALAKREYGGGKLEILQTVEANDHFSRYLITYPSDDLSVAGFMNVPNEGSKFPVAIVLHGYVPPAEYETLAYTQRYADTLAEAGYIVIHPNLRGYPPSDDGPDPFRIGMAADVLNLIAIIRQQSQDPLGPLRRADANDINLWGHSMGGGVALRVITVNNDEYLKTAVLYGAMSGDEVLNYGRIQQWSGGLRGDFELDAPPEMLNAISPINHVGRIEAAISVHHSDADDVVPLAWSTDLCRRLEARAHPHECHIYSGAPHTFIGVWDELFIERTIRFFNQH